MEPKLIEHPEEELQKLLDLMSYAEQKLNHFRYISLLTYLRYIFFGTYRKIWIFKLLVWLFLGFA